MSQTMNDNAPDDHAARLLGQLRLAAEHLRGADALSELAEADTESHPLAHRHVLDLRRELAAARLILAALKPAGAAPLPRADFSSIAQAAMRRIGVLRHQKFELASTAELLIHGDPAPLAAALVSLASLLPFGNLSASVRRFPPGEIGADKNQIHHGILFCQGEIPPLSQFRPAFSLKDLRLAASSHVGMAEALGCILQHGGEVFAAAAKNQLAIAIVLPALSSGPLSGAADEALQGSQLKGTETLLVVDDEDMIWDILSDHLQELGYTVILAENGLDAVETYKDNPGLFDLVILDMVMPKMGGREAFAEIRKIDPEARIIISSGYMAEGEAGDLLAAGACGFLRKPYRIAELARRIRQACGS